MEGFAGPQVLAEAAAQAMNKLDYTAQHMGMRIEAMQRIQTHQTIMQEFN